MTFSSYVRIMPESYVSLTLGNYVIKSCKQDQKITWQLRLEVTSGLRFKNHVRLALGSYEMKPGKWDQKITY